MRNGLSKDDVLTIIDYACKNNVSESVACCELGFTKFTNMSRYKKKYCIEIKNAQNSTGYKKRKYDVNDCFFSKPNVINSYYAGFIAADGYICGRKSEQRTLKIELSTKDKEWLYKFKENVNSESPIKERVQKNKFSFCGITITSKQIIDDLKTNFNITNKKSLILTPPNINDEMLRYAYILGYIDGDGSLFISSRKELILSILGTKEICEWVKFVFSNITNNCGSIKQKPNTKIYRLDYSSRAAREIVKKLSKIDVPKLNRKMTNEIIEYSKSYTKRHNHTFKKVFVYRNGNLIKKCDSLKEASNFTGVSYSIVSRILHKKVKQSNGFTFYFENI